MLVEELLFEMPKSINAISIDLDTPKLNRKHAIEFLKNNDREIIKEFSENVNLYEIGNKFVLIDEEEKHIIYFMEWKEIFHRFIKHQAASQILVWRDKTAGYNEIAKYMFFDILLEKYGVVITDTLQSEDGQRFWIRRIEDAFNRNLKVYYLNLLPINKNLNREMTQIHNTKEFNLLNKEKEFWGDTEKFKARKILISKVELS